MADTIVFGTAFKEDLTLGYGAVAGVVLPDGSSNTLNKIGIHTFLQSAYVSAADFAGATADVQIAAASAVLPAAGGIVDARSLTGAQTWAANPFTGVTAPVHVIMNASTTTVTGTVAIPSNITVELPPGGTFTTSGGGTLTIAGNVFAKGIDGGPLVNFIGNSAQRAELSHNSTPSVGSSQNFFTASFGMHDGITSAGAGIASGAFRVGLYAAVERGGASTNPHDAANFLTQFSTAGQSCGLEIDTNNNYADQQINDSAFYGGMTVLNGSTYINDKAIFIGTAAIGPAWSRGLILTNVLDRGVQTANVNSGVVSTNGTAVTYVAGTNFSTTWRGQIYINNVKYTIATVNSGTSGTLTGSAGVQTNVGYYYGYPDQAIYIDMTGTANTNGSTSFNSGKIRFVTSNWNGAAQAHSFDILAIATGATTNKFSFQYDSAEKALIDNTGQLTLASGVVTGSASIFTGTSINQIKVLPTDDVAGIVMFGQNAAGSQTNWGVFKNGDYLWLSGGSPSSATGKLFHANTAARTYGFPDLGGTVMVNSAVNSVSPTSANRTFTVNIGGTLYYIWGKTTND